MAQVSSTLPIRHLAASESSRHPAASLGWRARRSRPRARHLQSPLQRLRLRQPRPRLPGFPRTLRLTRRATSSSQSRRCGRRGRCKPRACASTTQAQGSYCQCGCRRARQRPRRRAALQASPCPRTARSSTGVSPALTACLRPHCCRPACGHLATRWQAAARSATAQRTWAPPPSSLRPAS